MKTAHIQTNRLVNFRQQFLKHTQQNESEAKNSSMRRRSKLTKQKERQLQRRRKQNAEEKRIQTNIWTSEYKQYRHRNKKSITSLQLFQNLAVTGVLLKTNKQTNKTRGTEVCAHLYFIKPCTRVHARMHPNADTHTCPRACTRQILTRM